MVSTGEMKLHIILSSTMHFQIYLSVICAIYIIYRKYHLVQHLSNKQN